MVTVEDRKMRRTLGLLLRLVPRRGLAVVAQAARRPEQAARDQVEVACVGDGLVVVAERRGEDAALPL